ncbi:MAG: hypothetical protein J6T64_07840 [Bacteroidaceae bacterium]|nr:hypothetical protein [Bacteroidaceae bacterium]
MKKVLLFLWLLIPLSTSWAWAEDGAWTFDVGTDARVGGGQHAPFWLTANRHGLASLERNSAYLRTSVLHDYRTSQGFDWECGIDAAFGTLNNINIGIASDASGWGDTQFVLQQLYAGVRYGCWQLTLGSREHTSQGKNARLSSGGMTWCGNARPIPQVRLGIYDYAVVPFVFHDWLSVKGFVSYGRTTDDAFQRRFVVPARYALYTRGALFHEKSFFFRVGRRDVSPLALEIGLEMNCQFGGELWEHDTRLDPSDADKRLYANPRRAADFLKALLPLSGGDGSTVSDQNNAAGNHFGSIHAALNYEPSEWQLRAYYEHYFDGRTGMTPWNKTRDMAGQPHVWIAYPWFDGLYGLEFSLPRNPIVSTVVVEYNTTRDQCGAIHHSSTATLPASIHGFACYYYNSSYPSYQHHGMTAGSPLLYSPLYNADHTLINTDTRLRALHLGISGDPTPALRYRLLGTFVRSWGSYMDPLPDPQNTFSTLAEVTWAPQQLRGWAGTAALALDRSPRLGNNVGVEIGIRKRFALNEK